MNRRQALLATGTLAISPLLRAQTQRVSRVGILLPAKTNEGILAPYRKKLAVLGWVEGRNLAIETRNADSHYERLPALARELADLKVDVIVAASTPATRAAKDATATIPVVFAWVADPVASGLVASLARPGGNLTGLSNVAFEIAPKQLELLKALLPGLKRVAELRDPKFEGAQAMSAQLKDAATRAGVELVHVEASAAGEIEGAFEGAARARATAMLVPPLSMYAEQGKRIAELAIRYRIPTASQYRSFVVAGGLVSYGSDLLDGFLRTAAYVDRILRGAKPADLPVEQADRFETVVNRRTAKALGIAIPQAVLLRASEVID